MNSNFLKEKPLIGFTLLILSPFNIYAAPNTCNVFPTSFNTYLDNTGSPHDATLATVTGDDTVKVLSLPTSALAHKSAAHVSMLATNPKYNQVYTFTYHMANTGFDCYVEVTTGCLQNEGAWNLEYQVASVQRQGDTDHNRKCKAIIDYTSGSPHLTITISGDK